MNVFLCSSFRHIENSLSSRMRIASSFSIFVSTSSISSPTFDHC